MSLMSLLCVNCGFAFGFQLSAFGFRLSALSFKLRRKAAAYHVAQSAKIFSRPSSDRSFDLLNSLETMPL